MRFSIQADLTYRFASACEVLLLIEAAPGPDQMLHSERLVVSSDGAVARLDDPFTGDRRTVFAAHGDVSIAYEAVVEVPERHHDPRGAAISTIRDLPANALPYLRASRYCPSDRFESFVSKEFGHLDGGDKVSGILNWIAANLSYRSGSSNGSTTAMDTFVEGAGVCRDFAHLAISLCRAADIPARAVSAYAWKLEPPDLHAVVEVYVGDRWMLVDPTGLAPVDGLVRVATGRDAADIAFMTIFGNADLLSQSFAIQRV